MALGKTIVFEGIDGSGKSTQVNNVAEFLADKGYSVGATKQPGGTQVGQAIRKILKDPSLAIKPRTERVLFAADNVDFMDTLEYIRNTKDFIIIDRTSFISEMAYGMARCNSEKEREELLTMLQTLNMVCKFSKFDLLFMLMTTKQEARVRRAKRLGEACRIEQDEAYMDKVVDEYIRMVSEKVFLSQIARKVVIIDANGSQEEIKDQVCKSVNEAIEWRREPNIV